MKKIKFTIEKETELSGKEYFHIKQDGDTKAIVIDEGAALAKIKTMEANYAKWGNPSLVEVIYESEVEK